MIEESRPGARRCTMCGLSFTNTPRWMRCAQCGGKTDIITDGTPNCTEEEAMSMLRHREFEGYLEKEGRE